MPAPPPPRQCPRERSARPAGPIPLPPTLTLAPVSRRSAGPAGRRERPRGMCESGRSPAEPPRHEAPATPEPAEAQGSAEPARPFRPRTSAARAGRDARGGDGGGARAALGAGLADMWAGPGLQLVLEPRPDRLELWLAVTQVLILAGVAALPGEYGCLFWQRHHHLSFIISFPRKWRFPASSLTEYSFCRHI